MYQIHFNKPVHVHFIGIGGISMSGLAELLHQNQFTVSGSDAKRSKLTEHLERIGIQVAYGQRAENLTDDTACVVYTAAVGTDNPELAAAMERGLPVLDRAELLGQLMLNYQHSIGVAGTHGKTTTTSMLSLILLEEHLDPTIAVGGILNLIGGNMRLGHSDYFVVESCEYTNSFLKFHPAHEIILNIEAEHLDYFKDLDEIRASFRQFAEKLPESGFLIINGEINQYEELTRGLDCHIITYGLNPDSGTDSNYNYTASGIQFDASGCGSYDCYRDGTLLGHIELKVIGLHNISNSLAALALADKLGVSFAAICTALASYTGTERRFEKKGEIGGITIIDDYAHHPSEIRATLTAAKNYPHQSIWCVFQPHTYSRTKSFLKETAEALSYADHVVLADIYAAREADPGDISSKDLLQKLQAAGTDAYYFPCFDEIENFLLSHCTNGDLLITMGAGDIVTIGEALLGS